MWNAAVMPQSEIPAMDLPGVTDESYEKFKMVGVPTEIQTRNLSNTKQKCRSPCVEYYILLL
jgi:hypothetical protein